MLPGPGPRTVLSIGPGDGSVDAPLARSLGAGRGPLRWVVAEPDAVVGERCRERVADVLGPGGDVVLHAGPFATVDEAVGAEQVDVVLAVHSLYYVPDLAEAVAAAADRLAPGGSLVVLLAPLEALCLLTEAVDPTSHRWWSGDLPAALAAAGLRGRTHRLAGQLDVTACFDPGSPTGRGGAGLPGRRRLLRTWTTPDGRCCWTRWPTSAPGTATGCWSRTPWTPWWPPAHPGEPRSTPVSLSRPRWGGPAHRARWPAGPPG